MNTTTWICAVFLAVVAAGALPLPVWSGEPEKSPPDRVKVAAVQMLGYDKTDLPRPDCDPTETVIRYVQRAAEDGGAVSGLPRVSPGTHNRPRARD